MRRSPFAFHDLLGLGNKYIRLLQNRARRPRSEATRCQPADGPSVQATRQAARAHDTVYASHVCSPGGGHRTPGCCTNARNSAAAYTNGTPAAPVLGTHAASPPSAMGRSQSTLGARAAAVREQPVPAERRERRARARPVGQACLKIGRRAGSCASREACSSTHARTGMSMALNAYMVLGRLFLRLY